MYRASHYAGDRGTQFIESRVFGTERAAELWAASILPTTVTTNDCYHRDVGRAPSVRLETDIGRAADNLRGSFVRYIEAPVRIVPSVGELGWSP